MKGLQMKKTPKNIWEPRRETLPPPPSATDPTEAEAPALFSRQSRKAKSSERAARNQKRQRARQKAPPGRFVRTRRAWGSIRRRPSVSDTRFPAVGASYPIHSAPWELAKRQGQVRRGMAPTRREARLRPTEHAFCSSPLQK